MKTNLIGLCVLLGLCVGMAQAEDTNRPNIIIILGDDQAWWDYSFMYRPEVEKASVDLDPDIHQVAHTPALDRLADEGLAFTHAYTTPLCRPSLAAMVTGTFPHHNRVTGNDLITGPDTLVQERMQAMQTIPRALVEQLGYTAFQTGKWWEGHYSNGGFTHGNTVFSTALDQRPPQWDGARPSYVSARHGDWGLMIGRVDYVNTNAEPAYPINYANTITPLTDFIDEQVANNTPFMAWYAPFLPHTPHDPPQGLLDIYDDRIDEPNEDGDYHAKYYANIERFDGGVGAILDHLDAAGIADNTIIMMYCDNGWINQDNQSQFAPKSKTSPYDGGIRTPVLVRWPNKIKVGGEVEPQIVTTPVSVIDVVPTALAAVGLEPSIEQSGVNLLDLDAVTNRTTIACDIFDHDITSLENPDETLVARIVVKDGWKLIRFVGGPSKFYTYTAGDKLFHLYESSAGLPIDPFETNDLSAVETAKVTELAALMETWYDEPKDAGWSVQASNMAASNSIALPDGLGQRFTVEADSYLAAIKIPFRQTDINQTVTLELRELNAAGAPTGTLLDQVTVQPDAVHTNGFYWCLFPFDQARAVSAGQQLGFQIKASDQPGSGCEIPYDVDGFYGGGKMYYTGVIENQSWDEVDYDLPFQTLHGNYIVTAEAKINFSPNGVIASAQMGVKDQPVRVQSTTNLVFGWQDVAEDPNRDGLVSVSDSLTAQQFYRFDLQKTGDRFILFGESLVLYEELFSGAGGSLNGVAPDTSENADVWTAPATAILADDGVAQTTSSATAYLPFSPENGHIYTLEVDIQQEGTPDADQWLACGFMKANPDTASSGGGLIWALTRNLSSNDNQVLHENASGGIGSVARGDYVTGTGTVSMKFVLDTRYGSGNWTYDWIVNDVERISNRSLSSAFEAEIGSVGISKYRTSVSHTFSSFKLTVQ